MKIPSFILDPQNIRAGSEDPTVLWFFFRWLEWGLVSPDDDIRGRYRRVHGRLLAKLEAKLNRGAGI